MLPQRLDITLAFKAISLSDVLSGTEKQVAAAIIDSFNFHTRQCDPSFDRIAHLVGKSRRTVIRAVKRIEKVGFLTKTRHGGHFHRNAYQPNWACFRSIEARWKARRRTRHWESAVSHSTVPSGGHLCGDKAGTQTIPINQSKETSPSQSTHAVPAEVEKVGEKASCVSVPRSSSRAVRRGAHSNPSPITDSATAARFAAERQWNYALLVRLREKPELYAQAIDALDPALQQEATEAELTCKGAGLRHVLNLLIARGFAA